MLMEIIKSEDKHSWISVLKKIICNLKDRETKFSHQQVRSLIKRKKRNLKRRLLARTREQHEDPVEGDDDPGTDAESSIREEYRERERRRQHCLWLQREEQAQLDFSRRKEAHRAHQLASDCKTREDRELASGPDDLEDKTEGDKEEVCRDLISRLPQVPDGEDQWHNPIAPQNYVPGIVKEREPCMFFVKTGACRFGERCSRRHDRPGCSNTLLVHNMFSHFGLDQALRDEYDTDLALEYEDSDTYQHFREFYEDVLPEFKKLGRVVQFKVCCNQEPHLRGNVYVQYSREEDAKKAYLMFNGRWYASRQLTCEFSPVKQWKMAICGLFHSKRCPKGRTCNFLHVFRNPTSEFWMADRGMVETSVGSRRTPSPRRGSGRRSGRRSRKRSESTSPRRSSSRSPKWSRLRRSRRSRSRSPRCSERTHSRSPRCAPREESRSESPESNRNRANRKSHKHKFSKTGGGRRRSESVRSPSDTNRRARRGKQKKRKKKHRRREESRSSSSEECRESATLMDGTVDELPHTELSGTELVQDDYQEIK